MTTGKAAAPKKKGAAAKPKEFTFRGVKLVGPPELPGSIGFDIGDIAVREESGDYNSAIAGLHRLVEGVLGRKELLKVRETIKGPDDEWHVDLLNVLLKAYKAGGSGKRSASAGS